MKYSVLGFTALCIAVGSPALSAAPGSSGKGRADAEKQRVIDHWTGSRRGAAIPRDLLIDKRGRGYLRYADGSLLPYARADQLIVTSPTTRAKPGGGGGGSDTTAPTISSISPVDGATIGTSADFSAVVTDAGGVRSVTFVVTYPDGSTTQNFTASFVGNDTWQVSLSGFTAGVWSWHVVATDNARRGGNTATSPAAVFTVDAGGGGGGGGGGGYVETNSPWTDGGVVQTAAGRIYFEMPDNARRRRWSGYVCSGTVATDAVSGRSVIITAAHCVYDDANKAFARNVLFIPDQDGTSGSGTDLNCSNDPIGCWVPSFGVVDVNWTTRTFPNNIPWDYAYYVVNDTGAHSGTSAGTDVLDAAAGSMAVQFTTPYTNDGDPSATSIDFTHALGYSYSDDPNFMYCAEDMTTEGADNWWLPSCGLSGGASGGPWVQPMNTGSGDGPIISVNSWGYTDSPGMAGPKLSGTSAECLFTVAKTQSFGGVSTTAGDAGVAVDCP